MFSAKGQTDKTIQAYRAAIKINPRYAEAYFNMSTSYQELRDFDRSIAAMNKAVKLNPDYA